MAISLLICDDLVEERGFLRKLVQSYEQRFGPEFHIETAGSGRELLALWKPRRWDLVLLDIYMPELSGIDTARQLRERDRDCGLIFVTTSREHGMESYDLRVSDYLTKPIVQEDLDRALQWFLQKHRNDLRELVFRSEWDNCAVRLRDIRYAEVLSHNMVVHTVRGDIATRKSMKELARELAAEEGFFHCHQSFLVNLAYVAGIGRHCYLMDRGEEVPISARCAQSARRALLEWGASNGWRGL